MSPATSREGSGARRQRPRSVSRSRMAIGGVAVLIGSLVLIQPASAGQDRDRVDRRASANAVNDQRPDRDIEVLSLACRIVDHATDRVSDQPADRPTDRLTDEKTDVAVVAEQGPTRIHIGCRWRPAESPAAAGYQLWRMVDRGERELVARGGLDMGGARDVVSAESHVVRYAVIAVNDHGRRVGQSRVVEIRLHDDRPYDRPVRHRRHSVG